MFCESQSVIDSIKSVFISSLNTCSHLVWLHLPEIDWAVCECNVFLDVTVLLCYAMLCYVLCYVKLYHRERIGVLGKICIKYCKENI